MSYAEIKVQDCYNTCFNGKLCRFLKISSLATKNHALNNKHRGKGYSCCIFRHFSEMKQVSVKSLDIACLLNMFMQKRDVSFFRHRLKNFDAYQLTCGVQFY